MFLVSAYTKDFMPFQDPPRGGTSTLRQQFGFANPDVIFKILNIYATSFYGSNLWNFSSQGSTRLFNSWNTMIRNVWGLSNVAHKYLIEHVSSSKHIRTIVYQRFLTFIQSLMRSKKKCLTALAKFVVNDPGSTTCQNLNIISIGGTQGGVYLSSSPKILPQIKKFIP